MFSCDIYLFFLAKWGQNSIPSEETCTWHGYFAVMEQCQILCFWERRLGKGGSCANDINYLGIFPEVFGQDINWNTLIALVDDLQMDVRTMVLLILLDFLAAFFIIKLIIKKLLLLLFLFWWYCALDVLFFNG